MMIMPSNKERKNFCCDYSQLISSAAVIFVVLDRRGKVVELNEFARRFIGYEGDEILGADWFDICVPDSKVIKNNFKAIVNGKVVPPPFFKGKVAAKDGRVRTVSWVTTFIRDANGRIEYDINLGYDITEAEAEEERHVATSQLMDSIFHTSPQAILSLDRNLVIDNWNESAERIFGYSRQEVLGKISPTIPKGSYESVKKMYAKVFEKGESLSYEGLRKRRDGTDVHIVAYAGPIRNNAGKVIGAMVLIEDITKHKQIEKTNAYLRQGIEKSDNAIFLTDNQGKITYVNPAFEALYGYRLSEVVGKTSRFIKSGKQSDEEYDTRWRTLMSGKNVAGEVRNRAKDGREVIVASSTNAVMDDYGNIIGFIAIQHDMTDEVNSKMKLAELTELNQQIINSSPLGIFILDRNGIIEYVNDKMLDISASPKEKLIGYNLLNNENYIRLGLSQRIMDSIHQGTAFETEPMKYRSLFGKKETYRIFSGSPIKSSDGKSSKVLITIRDVSELVSHNEELERFNSLMVGRELKMVELKSQVHLLKNRLASIESKKRQELASLPSASDEAGAALRVELVDDIDRIIGAYGQFFSTDLPKSELWFLEKYQIRHSIKSLINMNIESKKSIIRLIKKNERP